MAKDRIERSAAPLRQQVVRLIREDIVSELLKPGQRLVESAMCESYGVSRTVVREALRQLESEHLIEVLPSVGPIVRILTEDEIKAIYVVRAALEGLAGQLFALQATDRDVNALQRLRDRLEAEYTHGDVQSREIYKAEFYKLLLAGAKNDVLAEQLHMIHDRIALFRRYSFVDEGRVALSVVELSRIMDAAIRRDADGAREACEHHIRGAGELAVIEYERRARASLAETEKQAAPQGRRRVPRRAA